MCTVTGCIKAFTGYPTIDDFLRGHTLHDTTTAPYSQNGEKHSVSSGVAPSQPGGGIFWFIAAAAALAGGQRRHLNNGRIDIIGHVARNHSPVKQLDLPFQPRCETRCYETSPRCTPVDVCRRVVVACRHVCMYVCVLCSRTPLRVVVRTTIAHSTYHKVHHKQHFSLLCSSLFLAFSSELIRETKCTQR